MDSCTLALASAPAASCPLLGISPAITAIRRTLDQIAGTNLTVLLQGESGTGKEVVARLLGSQRGDGQVDSAEARSRPRNGVSYQVPFLRRGETLACRPARTIPERPGGDDQREAPGAKPPAETGRACPGRAASFVKINCAAIPDELWESELFGYEAGAFTGANRPKSGKFELAGDGTIFLDEIGEMPLQLQAKLLQVLQDGEFSRLGGRRSLCVDVRVVAATNCDLHAAVQAGLFRRDLFYRLNVILILLPPLRDRQEDIPLLFEHFLAHYSYLYRRQPPPPAPAFIDRLCQYSWPGNVRELENLIKRYVVLQEDDVLLAGTMDAPLDPRAAPAAVPCLPPATVSTPASLLEIGRTAAQQAERAAILKALADTRWNRRSAARQLHISYKSLQNKIRTLLAEYPSVCA